MALTAPMTAGALPAAVSSRVLGHDPSKTLATASSRVAQRLAALAIAARRWRLRVVPVEPVPSWARMPTMTTSSLVAITDSTSEMIAPRGLRPSGEVPTTAAAKAAPQSVGALSAASSHAVAGRAAPTSRPSRGAPPRSVKNGPPKAPRRRTRAHETRPVAVAIPSAATGAAIPTGADLPAASPGLIAHKAAMIGLVQSPAVERVRSTRAQEIGDEGERLAAFRLEALGWRILARNLRVNRVEVDILAIDPSEPPSLVLVEVRRRNRRDFGLAEESVDYRKRNALRRAAGELAMRPVLGDGRRLPELPVRVDLIAIDRGPNGRPSVRHHRGIEV
jgi:putative endonuclease